MSEVVTDSGQVPTPEQSAPAPKTPAAPPPPSLAELISQDRADRAAKAKEQSEVSRLAASLKAAEEKLSKYQSEMDDLVLDPSGFATRRGLNDAQRAMVGQALLYDLVPDKAPPDHRAKMLEAQLKRRDQLSAAKEKEQSERAAAQAAEAEQKAKAAQVSQYADGLGAAADTWDKETAHPFPISRTWFSEEPENYKLSLLHTAVNMADAAQAKGEVADLSPKNVAKVFEEHMAAKVSRVPRKEAPQGSTPVETQKPVSGGGPQTPPVEKPSTRTKKLTSDEERILRAAAVVFPTS